MILIIAFLIASINGLEKSYLFLTNVLSTSPPVKNYNVNETFIPLQRIFIISTNESSYADEFAFLATLPLAVFHHENSVYVSPILFSDLAIAEENLLKDWVSYTERHGNISCIIGIGSISLDDQKKIQEIVEKPIYPSFPMNDLYALSAKLALLDWTNSNYIILTPIPSDFSTPEIYTIEDTWNLQFINASIRSASQLVNISKGDVQKISFEAFKDEGWIEGSIQGLSTSVVTSHFLLDPSGFNVSYSRYLWMKYLIEQEGKNNDFFIVPNANPGIYMLNIVGNEVNGSQTLNISLSFHASLRRTLIVPENSVWLNLTLSWDDYNDDLDLVAISPNGIVAGWSISDNKDLESEEKLHIYSPMSGEWTILTSWYNGTGNLNATLSYKLVTKSNDVEKYLEVALNAAVLSSKLNAPLLYTSVNNLSSDILDVLLKLSASKVILVDPYRMTSSDVLQKITATGVTLEILDSKESLYSKNLENVSNGVVITIPDEKYFPASALIAAYHKMPVVVLPRKLITMVEASWTPFIPEHEQYEGTILDDLVPHFYVMKRTSDMFFEFLEVYGIHGDVFIVVSPLTLLKPTFDRAIIGKAIVGRIIGSDEREAVVFALRNILYPALIFSNPNRNKALLSFFAYTEGASFHDNYGAIHDVYERIYINVSLASYNYITIYQVGMDDVLNTLNNGVSVWMLSTHGNVIYRNGERLGRSGFFALSSQSGKWGIDLGGSIDDPDGGDNIVDSPQYSTFIYDYEFDRSVHRMGSSLVVISACLIGASKVPEILLRHGAAFVLAPVRTIYFEAGGWFTSRFFEEIANNATLGEAWRKGIIDSSDVYSEGFLSESDWSLTYILFGDPLLRLYTSSWKEPLAIEPQSVIAGGHIPNYGLHDIAIVSIKGYLLDDLGKVYPNGSLKVLNVSVIDIENLVSQIYLFKVVIFESETLKLVNNDLENYKSAIESFIENGGIIIVLGVEEESIEWLPLKIESNTSKHGSDIKILFTSHPLVNNPNPLGEDMEYYGIFTKFDPRYFVLATNEEGYPVWLASSYHLGKITVLTLKPDINNDVALLQNLFAWKDVSMLFIQSLNISKTSVLKGEKVKMTLKLTNQYLQGISDAKVEVYVGSIIIEAVSLGNGSYTATIDTSELKGTVQIIVKAFKEGYDPVSSILILKVNTYTQILLVLFIIILIIVIALILKKRKRKMEIAPEIKPIEIKPLYKKPAYICPFCQSHLSGPYMYCPYCGSYTGFKERE